jgi:hypothetical protein
MPSFDEPIDWLELEKEARAILQKRMDGYIRAGVLTRNGYRIYDGGEKFSVYSYDRSIKADADLNDDLEYGGGAFFAPPTTVVVD